MSCSSCGTKKGGCAPAGCKSNGTCATTGCNKLNVYDWLRDMDLPDHYQPFNVIEVRFKGSRKEFYRNEGNIELFTGDPVLVQRENGTDIGFVSLKGELVRLQLKKHGVDENAPQMHKLLRKAGERDMERYNEVKAREPKTLERARTLSMELGLKMKLSDIEFQGDAKKVTFFYTAEDRVDFRELIKKYADEFKVRIEMKQIGYRQEAARLGGIGSCGRELCCSTWLTDFKVVNTSAARYQNLSINMLKLSGQCGKLKCCLNYELDTYLEALEEFPRGETVRLETQSGMAISQKVDILKKMMWFAYEGNSNWIGVDISKVNEILAQNKEGIKPSDLMDTQEGSRAMQKALDAEDIISDNSLTRLEEKEGNRRKKKKNKSRKPQRENGAVTENNTAPRENKPREQKPREGRNPENRQPRPQGTPNAERKPAVPREGNPNPTGNRNRNNRNRNPRNPNANPNPNPENNSNRPPKDE